MSKFNNYMFTQTNIPFLIVYCLINNKKLQQFILIKNRTEIQALARWKVKHEGGNESY